MNHKHFKKRLVMTLKSHSNQPAEIPSQYQKNDHWLGKIYITDRTGAITEYEVIPDGKLTLEAFLVRIKSHNTVCDINQQNYQGWAIKIYRLIKRQ